MIRKHPDRGTVEFLLDRDGADVPHVMGSWDGWQRPGIPMVRQPGEAAAWTTEVPLPPGEHQFRYRIGDDWENDATADRSVANGFGGENSVVVVEERPKRRGAALHPECPAETSGEVNREQVRSRG
jgi:hypothetical protein